MENRLSNKHLYRNVHSSTVHSHQEVKTNTNVLQMMDGWTNKIWYVHTIEYYSAMKRSAVLTHAITWANLENIMQSGRTRHNWPHIVDVICRECPEEANPETGSRLVVARSWGEEERGSDC